MFKFPISSESQEPCADCQLAPSKTFLAPTKAGRQSRKDPVVIRSIRLCERCAPWHHYQWELPISAESETARAAQGVGSYVDSNPSTPKPKPPPVPVVPPRPAEDEQPPCSSPLCQMQIDHAFDHVKSYAGRMDEARAQRDELAELALEMLSAVRVEPLLVRLELEPKRIWDLLDRLQKALAAIPPKQ